MGPMPGEDLGLKPIDLACQRSKLRAYGVTCRPRMLSTTLLGMGVAISNLLLIALPSIAPRATTASRLNIGRSGDREEILKPAVYSPCSKR